MPVVTHRLSLSTNGNAEITDITPGVRDALNDSGLANGTVTVFCPGATGGVTTIEFEPGLVEDITTLWERLAPHGEVYNHDRAWGDGNGHSHLRASLLGPSLTVPFVDGELTLGTWQQIIFIDFDVRPRSRQVVLQFMGE